MQHAKLIKEKNEISKEKSKEKSMNSKMSSAQTQIFVAEEDEKLDSKTMTRVKLLKSLDLFSELSAGDIKQVAKVMDCKRYKKGDYVFHRDSRSGEFVIVTEGEVEIIVPGGSVYNHRQRHFSFILREYSK